MKNEPINENNLSVRVSDVLFVFLDDKKEKISYVFKDKIRTIHCVNDAMIADSNSNDLKIYFSENISELKDEEIVFQTHAENWMEVKNQFNLLREQAYLMSVDNVMYAKYNYSINNKDGIIISNDYVKITVNNYKEVFIKYHNDDMVHQVVSNDDHMSININYAIVIADVQKANDNKLSGAVAIKEKIDFAMRAVIAICCILGVILIYSIYYNSLDVGGRGNKEINQLTSLPSLENDIEIVHPIVREVPKNNEMISLPANVEKNDMGIPDIDELLTIDKKQNEEKLSTEEEQKVILKEKEDFIELLNKALDSEKKESSTVVEPNEKPTEKILEFDRETVGDVLKGLNGVSASQPEVKAMNEPVKELKPEVKDVEIDLPTSEEIKKESEDIVKNMIDKGMSKTEIANTLKNIQDIADAADGLITPEMLSKLPEDIAKSLRDMNMVMEEGDYVDENGTPFRIIKIPNEILRQYKSPVKNIYTIPDANSWAATGNMMHISPPGGGNYRHVDDLAEMGLYINKKEDIEKNKLTRTKE